MMHFDKFLTKPQVEDSEEFAAFETWYGVPFKEYCEEIRKEENKIEERSQKRYDFDEYLD